jgi:hypothetical protein
LRWSGKASKKQEEEGRIFVASNSFSFSSSYPSFNTSLTIIARFFPSETLRATTGIVVGFVRGRRNEKRKKILD